MWLRHHILHQCKQIPRGNPLWLSMATAWTPPELKLEEPLAAISILLQVVTKHNTEINYDIIITLDNKQAARLAQRWLGSRPDYNRSDKYQDLLMELNRLHERIGSPPMLVQWDKGHTEVTNKNKVTWTTRQIFNDRADNLAKMIWQTDLSHPMHSRHEDPLLPSTKWHLHINNKRMTNVVNTKVTDAIESHIYKKRFKEKWPTASIDDFHWEALQRITENLPLCKMTGHLKCVHSQWATLDVLATRANSDKIPNCPFGCRCPDNNQHVIHCSRPINTKLHESFLADVDQCLRKHSTPNDIKKDLINALKLWSKGETVEGRKIGIAAKLQERLGPEHIFRGPLALMWTERWIADQEKKDRWHTDIARILLEWDRAC